MSGTETLTLRETVRRAPRWASLYLPTGGLDALVEALWLFSLGWEASRAGWASGLVLAAGALPAILFLFWGGGLADRLGARRVATWTMLGRVLVMAAWAAVVVSDTAPAYLAAAAAAAVGTIAGIHDPAVQAIPQSMVPKAGLEVTQNAQRVTVRIVQAIGPMLGGLLAAWAGMGPVVVTAAVIGLIPLAGLLAIRRLPDTHPDDKTTTAAMAEDPQPDLSRWQKTIAGWRWVIHHPAFRWTVPLQGVINMTTATIILAALPRQSRIYGWGPDVYGLASALFAGGLLLGSLAAFTIRTGQLPRFRRRRRPQSTAASNGQQTRQLNPHRAAVAVASAGVSSVMVAVTGTATDQAVAIAAAALMGLTLGPVGAILTGWTIASAQETDPALAGRVWAVLLLVTVGAEPLGFLIYSALADAASMAAASLAFGAVGILVVLLALTARAVRVAS